MEMPLSLLSRILAWKTSAAAATSSSSPRLLSSASSAPPKLSSSACRSSSSSKKSCSLAPFRERPEPLSRMTASPGECCIRRKELSSSTTRSQMVPSRTLTAESSLPESVARISKRTLFVCRKSIQSSTTQERVKLTNRPARGSSSSLALTIRGACTITSQTALTPGRKLKRHQNCACSTIKLWCPIPSHRGISGMLAPAARAAMMRKDAMSITLCVKRFGEMLNNKHMPVRRRINKFIATGIVISFARMWRRINGPTRTPRMPARTMSSRARSRRLSRHFSCTRCSKGSGSPGGWEHARHRRTKC
mmetsp:Transcript_67647/g.209167  ORF Transcript_67647/g.209167 Transcript_67647/m.209167 type:complete len:306 (+) Transcript_67647:632-1549(+)